MAKMDQTQEQIEERMEALRSAPFSDEDVGFVPMPVINIIAADGSSMPSKFIIKFRRENDADPWRSFIYKDPDEDIVVAKGQLTITTEEVRDAMIYNIAHGVKDITMHDCFAKIYDECVDVVLEFFADNNYLILPKHDYRELQDVEGLILCDGKIEAVFCFCDLSTNLINDDKLLQFHIEIPQIYPVNSDTKILSEKFKTSKCTLTVLDNINHTFYELNHGVSFYGKETAKYIHGTVDSNCLVAKLNQINKTYSVHPLEEIEVEKKNPINSRFANIINDNSLANFILTRKKELGITATTKQQDSVQKFARFNV